MKDRFKFIFNEGRSRTHRTKIYGIYDLKLDINTKIDLQFKKDSQSYSFIFKYDLWCTDMQYLQQIIKEAKKFVKKIETYEAFE